MENSFKHLFGSREVQIDPGYLEYLPVTNVGYTMMGDVLKFSRSEELLIDPRFKEYLKF